MTKERFCKIISPFLFILIWYGVAALIAAPLILPYPHAVLLRLFELCRQAMFWKAFLFTFLRIILAFIISFAAGFVTGLLSADYPAFKALLQFPFAVIRVTPSIACILFALFWFTSDLVPVFTACLMAFPVITSACEKGFAHTPENQEKLFRVKSRGFTGLKAFLYVRLPAARQAMFSGLESGFGLCWKVVVAGEVLSIPHFAAGSLMQKSQVHLETADTLAVTLAIVIFSFTFQKAFNMIKLRN